MKVFWILNGGKETASSRERILRYLPDLKKVGIKSHVHIAGKIRPSFLGRIRYWRDFLYHLYTSSTIFIHRVSLNRTERCLIRISGRRVIFDLDDAIWYQIGEDHRGNPVKSKRFQALRETIILAKLIRCGNEELAKHLRPLGKKIQIAPTCVPRNRAHIPSGNENPIIGWIGHSSNFRYFKVCEPGLRKLVKKHPHVRIRIVADRPLELDGVPTEFEPWSLEGEDESIQKFDIGIMPLEDTQYARGKCGYKLLRYMGAGIPAIGSPVGVNETIGDQGGARLASSPEEWKAHLETLLHSPDKRKEQGDKGITTVKGTYDIDSGLTQLKQALGRVERNKNRRISMILFHHPPLGGSAAFRNSLLALHLKKRGWTPLITSASNLKTYFTDDTIEHTPASNPTPGYTIQDLLRPLHYLKLRKAANWITKLISFPDQFLPWVPVGFPKALSEARKSSVIFSTSPPESAHLFAWILKKLTGRPWIADHSNEWSDNPVREETSVRKSANRFLERFLMKSADQITTLSPFHTRLLEESYPRPERITTLWTGWNKSSAQPASKITPKESFQIFFAGMFYGIQRPDPFLNAVKSSGIKDMEFHVFGNIWDSSQKLNQATIPVFNHGRVSRDIVLAKMEEADFLLITLTSQATGVVPGKMFEYAAAGKPILAVVPPDGEVARWVKQTGTGFVIPCAPTETAAEELSALMKKAQEGKLAFHPNEEELEKFTTEAMGDLFSEIVEKATNTTP